MCRLLGPGGLMVRSWGQAGNGHTVRPPERGEAGTGRHSLVIPGKPRYPGGTSLSWESLVIPAEPRYPGTAHCFFAQEPVEAGGEREWDHAGTPQQCRAGGDSLSLTPWGGPPPCAPLKTAAPLALPPWGSPGSHC